MQKTPYVALSTSSRWKNEKQQSAGQFMTEVHLSVWMSVSERKRNIRIDYNEQIKIEID